MKEPHSNEQTSLGVLMTPAQKAAADIWSRIYHYYGVPADSLPPAWIQEVVQSALDAAGEQLKQRELELAAKWRSDAYIAHPGYSYANGRLMSADELESLAKEK